MMLDAEDRKKIERIIAERKNAHEFLLNKKTKTYEAFLSMEKAAFGPGALEKKHKELVALGISVAINCESCMEWHTGQALTAGAQAAEILETIEVAMEMGGGPATVAARFALKALEYHRENKT